MFVDRGDVEVVQNIENNFLNEFDLEERYLEKVYGDMLESQREWADFIDLATTEGLNTVQKLSEDIRVDFSSYSDNIDTLATIEMKNREIDQMNSRLQSSRILLDNVNRSLQSPYFGKVIVDFLDGEQAEPFYIGINSYTNSKDERLVYDWRSPIAELFYNNELGDSSYNVNSNLIEVKINNRRQFVIEKDKLLRYFDTSVAIQDDVLLEALEQNSSDQLQDITSTIQSEQNVIIRDTEHPLLLVNGVAGSGKTSTIMQRIAYLLYTYNDKISSDNFMILSPNEHFVEYISNVLPSLGERTPLNLTFRQFISNHLKFKIEREDQYFERISQDIVDDQTQILRSEALIRSIEDADELLASDLSFIQAIYRKDKQFLSKSKIISIFNQTPTQSTLLHRIQATKQLLLRHWEERMINLSKNPKIIDRILSLPEELQYRFFGDQITDDSKGGLQRYALKYLHIQFGKVRRDIVSMNWIDLPLLFKQLFKEYAGYDYHFNNTAYFNLDEAVVLLFIYNQFVEKISMSQMKFLLIDEIQDYTSAQILLLNKLFPRSQFTMVGDENQSIFNSYIAFNDIIQHFDNRSTRVELYNLLNSYRSSGSITNFFSHFALNNDQWKIVPIRPEGNLPSMNRTENIEELIQYIEEIQKVIGQQALTIITKTAQQADDLIAEIGEQRLKSLECNILPITLSKGLEFDHVLIHQVSQDNYHTEGDRRILYTAASRAMKNLFISYSDSLSVFIPKAKYIELFN